MTDGESRQSTCNADDLIWHVCQVGEKQKHGCEAGGMNLELREVDSCDGAMHIERTGPTCHKDDVDSQEKPRSHCTSWTERNWTSRPSYNKRSLATRAVQRYAISTYLLLIGGRHCKLGRIVRELQWERSRAAVGMRIPMGMGMGWVWGLWWIPMGLWGFYGDVLVDVRLSRNALNTL